MSKSVFVSFAGTDRHWLGTIRSWNNQGLLGPGLYISGERDDYRQGGETAIRDELKSLIKGASVVLFLVGDNSHNPNWVNYEVSLANSYHKRIIVACIPDTYGGPPPALANEQIIPLDPSSLRMYLQR